MKKISIGWMAMERLRKTGVLHSEYGKYGVTAWSTNNLLCWENHTKTAEQFTAKLQRIVKKRFVIREIYYSPDCNDITFYVFLCRFTAWLHGWGDFHKESCGTYIADPVRTINRLIKEGRYAKSTYNDFSC